MDNITLLKGNHGTREQGVCVMEAVAWFAGETHSDGRASMRLPGHRLVRAATE